MTLRQKERISDTNKATLYLVGSAAEAFGHRSMCGSDLVGTPMKSAIAAHLPDEHFVIRVDGRAKSHHRRFLDGLREGLQHRDQFPQRSIKLRAQASRVWQQSAASASRVAARLNKLSRS
jgi:hypothetical protein